ncbi:hypothetical protein R1sor_018536 [Riccia sorocarpa]|uniref:Uncharacterized protein n=1 Tax=Riccia sorocarpa TaxID=122646 RepID=A0ABD3ID95_9MARC
MPNTVRTVHNGRIWICELRNVGVVNISQEGTTSSTHQTQASTGLWFWGPTASSRRPLLDQFRRRDDLVGSQIFSQVWLPYASSLGRPDVPEINFEACSSGVTPGVPFFFGFENSRVGPIFNFGASMVPVDFLGASADPVVDFFGASADPVVDFFGASADPVVDFFGASAVTVVDFFGASAVSVVGFFGVTTLSFFTRAFPFSFFDPSTLVEVLAKIRVTWIKSPKCHFP